MLSEKLKDKIKNINFTKTLDVFYIYNKMNPDTQLNLNEIIILNLIISYEMIGQKCHLNYEQLGEKICKNEKTAKTAIKGLKEKGLIDWKPGNSFTGFANIYNSTKKLHNIINQYADIPSE